MAAMDSLLGTSDITTRTTETTETAKTTKSLFGRDDRAVKTNKWAKGKTDMERARGVVVCVGLGEEGLHEKGERALLSYRENMPRIVARLQEAGKIVVVANSYPSDNFNEVDLSDLQDINIEVQQWDIPTINWAEGKTMAAIPQTLFEALKDGKPLPNYISTEGDRNGIEAVQWVAETGIESYTLSFESRDTVLAVVYRSGEGRTTWYKNGAQAEMKVVKAFSNLEQVKDTFRLRGENLHQIRFYRAAMTPREVKAVADGKMLRSSLELYCPLRGGDKTNFAQTKNTISTMEIQ